MHLSTFLVRAVCTAVLAGGFALIADLILAGRAARAARARFANRPTR